MRETKELNETEEVAKAMTNLETALESMEKLTEIDVTYLDAKNHLNQSIAWLKRTFVRRDQRGWID